MCADLTPSPSDTSTARRVVPVPTRRCPACPDAKLSATAAPAKAESGSTPLRMACRCGRRFSSLADLLDHWRACHEDDWAERHMGQPQPLRLQDSRGVLA